MENDADIRVSAGDLEKFSYCPLSWWLSEKFESRGEELDKGIREHDEIGRSLWEIDAEEKSASQSETMVFWYAVTATVIAIIGLELVFEDDFMHLSEIMGVVALIWVLAASFFLFKATRSTIKSKTLAYEKIVLIFAIVAVIIAVNAVGFVMQDDRLAQALEFAALLWLIAASYFLYRSLKSADIAQLLRNEFKIKGKIEYIDMDDSKVFISEKYGISGKPDYVMKLGDQQIPVEVKKGRTPQGPLFSHIVQIAAYCLLIEDATGIPPPYGVLRYPEQEHEIEYNEDMKKVLLEKVQDIRRARIKGEAHRNHKRPGKCRSCSRRDFCPEKIA
ncbi:MAG: CRISPR-associated protein Cas4 [Methanobacteriota archaeon]|nr:MAG: CRISPR-associated protein Cas4 [Euryarchaeota archaeon]